MTGTPVTGAGRRAAARLGQRARRLPRRARHLSLRARLLAGLIAVIAVFLIVMGTVSTVVLSRLESDQFLADLRLTAKEPPSQIAAAGDGYAAAYLNVTSGKVGQLTPASPAGEELLDVLTPLARTPAERTMAFWLAERRKDVPFSITIPGTPVPGRATTGTTTSSRAGISLQAATGSPPAPTVGRSSASYRTAASSPALRAVWRPLPATQVRGGLVPPGKNVLLVARPASAITSEVRGLIAAEVITGGGLLALLAVGGNWLIARGLAPLGRMAGTANRITARGDLTERMPATRDDGQQETGRLAAAINTMLDRIQQSFADRLRSEEKVRQFAADASHEMRTPLTTIRGYAELYRAGAIGPSELPNAMRRIEQEAERMSTLVAELLELARLDRDSSLDLTETDLAELVRDAVTDACAVEPDRPISAQVPARPLIATVDEPRLRQVLANLLANVRAHTPSDTPAAVTLRYSEGGALLEVADKGPGMPEADTARVFDRFYRAARPGDPASGSGLGLSIVQAIAAAHGGRARLDSAPGAGTTVQVWIPQRPQPA
ncbi:MAG TPA: HAMP domain-containing sensor histidine kinase [Trebonia sp.]|nr:HAMP domain-containing sensor histidine kinase [Trebonia sp.]